MKIALCDDDGRFRAQTARSLEDILEKRDLEVEVAKFRSAEELLAAMAEGAAFDFYLLDIIMPGIDGVALARRIRERQATAPILFFTTSTDFAVEAFAVGAAHYVVKPFTREEFTGAIDRALALLPRTSATNLVLKTSQGLVTVQFGDLVYSETDEHYQLVHVVGGAKVISRLSGTDLWRKLEPTGMFVRAGLKYVINLRHITGIGKGEVMLEGGLRIEVPRRSMAELRTAYLRFSCQ